MHILILLQKGTELVRYGWEVQSMLLSAIVALSGAVVYLYKSKETALKEKDAQIMAVIKEHQQDLRENTTDMKNVAENYFKFTQTIKDIVNGSGRKKA